MPNDSLTNIKFTPQPYERGINGHLPANRADELVHALKSIHPYEPKCICPFSILETNETRIGRCAGQHCQIPGREIIITNFFPQYLCVKDKGPGASSCDENIARGKCVDEFIRATIGKYLFPELYVKEK